jgi:cytochrome c oxidase assembly protein subunit 15
MRHLGAGLAIPDFPLAFGKVIPAFTSVAIVANFAHRAWGIIVACIILGFGPAVMTKTRGALRGIYGTLLVAVVVQILFGAFTVWSAKAPLVTSVHVVTGAFVLGTALVFALTAALVETRVDARVVVGREATA